MDDKEKAASSESSESSVSSSSTGEKKKKKEGKKSGSKLSSSSSGSSSSSSSKKDKDKDRDKDKAKRREKRRDKEKGSGLKDKDKDKERTSSSSSSSGKVKKKRDKKGSSSSVKKTPSSGSVSSSGGTLPKDSPSGSPTTAPGSPSKLNLPKLSLKPRGATPSGSKDSNNSDDDSDENDDEDEEDDQYDEEGEEEDEEDNTKEIIARLPVPSSKKAFADPERNPQLYLFQLKMQEQKKKDRLSTPVLPLPRRSLTPTSSTSQSEPSSPSSSPEILEGRLVAARSQQDMNPRASSSNLFTEEEREQTMSRRRAHTSLTRPKFLDQIAKDNLPEAPPSPGANGAVDALSLERARNAYRVIHRRSKSETFHHTWDYSGIDFWDVYEYDKAMRNNSSDAYGTRYPHHLLFITIRIRSFYTQIHVVG